MTAILYSMPYSPWSERARFALLHHGREFDEREHVPLLGELALHFRARKFWARVTVPLLVEAGVAIMDSLAIAEHVDAAGTNSRLFPEAHRAAIRAFNERIEPMFQAARARALHVGLADDEAALDLTPAALRALPLAKEMTRLGMRVMAWKHPTPSGGVADRLRAGLVDVRSALGGRPYIHEHFSYADIIAATALQLVAPVDERFVPIGPVKRRTWSDPALAAEFSEVVKWRDALYEKHRPVRQPRVRSS
jgi:glutathione S-transferase